MLVSVRDVRSRCCVLTPLSERQPNAQTQSKCAFPTLLRTVSGSRELAYTFCDLANLCALQEIAAALSVVNVSLVNTGVKNSNRGSALAPLVKRT